MFQEANPGPQAPSYSLLPGVGKRQGPKGVDFKFENKESLSGRRGIISGSIYVFSIFGGKEGPSLPDPLALKPHIFMRLSSLRA